MCARAHRSHFSFTQNHVGVPLQQQQQQQNQQPRQNNAENNRESVPSQSYQQRTSKQLLEINEILSKSKAVFSQLPKMQEQKVFPEEPPPPPPMNIDTSEAIIARTAKVSLNRLNIEDAELMQKSLTEFAMKSPDLARKLGVIKDESDPFSQMKANGMCVLLFLTEISFDVP